MRRLVLLFLGWAAVHADEARPWTLAGVAPLEAELVAADGLRATLLVPGRGKTVIPFVQMSAADVAYVREWRAQNPRRRWSIPSGSRRGPRRRSPKTSTCK